MRSFIVASCLFLLAAFSATTVFADAPTGKWRVAVQMDDGSELGMTFVLKQDGDKLSGTLTGDDGMEVEVSDIKWKDDELSFSLSRDFGGQELKTEFTGTVSGNKFEGSVDYDLGGQTGTLAVTGEKEGSASPAGKWKLAISTPDGAQLQPTLNLTQDGDKLGGTLAMDDGTEAPLEDVSLSGDELKFAFTADFGGQSLTSKFTTKLDGNKLAGTVEYDLGGQTGELEVTGEKEGAASASPAGEWVLSISTPDGAALAPTLKLEQSGESLGGVLAMDDGTEAKLEDVSFADGNLKFAFTADFGGQSLTSKFDTKVDGDKLAGTVEYDLGGQTGELEVTGERKSSASAEGEWQLAISTPDGAMLAPVLNLKKDGDKLGGTLVADDGTEAQLEDVSFEGGNLKFAFKADFGGQSLVSKFDTKVDGDKLTGTVEFDLGGQTGVLDVTGERKGAGGLAGTWNLTVNSEAGVFEPKLHLTQEGGKLAGKYEWTPDTVVEITEAKFEGGELTYGAQHDFDGQELIVTYKLKVDGEKLSGDVDYDLGGQTGTATVEGAKAKAGSAAAIKIDGKWKLSITLEDGQSFDATVDLKQAGDAVTGNFSGPLGDTEISEAKLDGNKLCFQVPRERDGKKVVFNYMGTLDGDKLAGTIEFELDGQEQSAKFEGVRE